MNDEHLPGFYHDAEAFSRLGQRLTLLFSRTRLNSRVSRCPSRETASASW